MREVVRVEFVHYVDTVVGVVLGTFPGHLTPEQEDPHLVEYLPQVPDVARCLVSDLLLGALILDPRLGVPERRGPGTSGANRGRTPVVVLGNH